MAGPPRPGLGHGGDRRCHRIAWEFPSFSAPLGGPATPVPSVVATLPALVALPTLCLLRWHLQAMGTILVSQSSRRGSAVALKSLLRRFPTHRAVADALCPLSPLSFGSVAPFFTFPFSMRSPEHGRWFQVDPLQSQTSPALTSSKAQNKIKALHTSAARTLRACPSPKKPTLLQLECLIQHLSFHFVVYI